MTPYSQLLRDGANEVLQYLQTHDGEPSVDPNWYGRLADEMKRAAELDDQVTAENEIRGIARLVVDSFPLSADFAPTFQAALTAVHNAERRRRRGEK